jgi:hypothetical protein
MRLPRLSRRQVFESASLLLVGFALVAIAIRLFTRFLLDFDAIAFTFWFVGCTLIGAGALCQFRRRFSGGLIGFVVSVYLLFEPANTDGNGYESFMKAAEEIAATHAEATNIRTTRAQHSLNKVVRIDHGGGGWPCRSSSDC